MIYNLLLALAESPYACLSIAGTICVLYTVSHVKRFHLKDFDIELRDSLEEE